MAVEVNIFEVSTLPEKWEVRSDKWAVRWGLNQFPGLYSFIWTSYIHMWQSSATKIRTIQSFQNENKDEDVDGDVDDEREKKRD